MTKKLYNSLGRLWIGTGEMEIINILMKQFLEGGPWED
jgi:hypothetical protein